MISKKSIFISILSLIVFMGCDPSNADLIEESLNTPFILTEVITEITPNSAIGGGNVATNGNAEITDKGLVWHTSPNPTITNFTTGNGGGIGEFSSVISGLLPGTIYYVKAYAINANGLYYGNEISFITLEDDGTAPIIATTAITGITNTTAIGGGTISTEGGAEITERGIVWSTNTNPTTSDFKTTEGSGTGNFTSNLTNLLTNTTYYVRAYATNTNGTFYGNEFNFNTLQNEAPALTTLNATNITTNTATSGGNISSEGGAEITERGVVWSTTINPTVDDFKTVDGSGLGDFTSNLTGLISNTTYYIRAYATNSNGVFYANEVSFTTLGNTTQYAIGDIGPGGGFVFEIDASGTQGKEIAPLSTQFQSQWGCPTTSVSGTLANAGSGQSNSTLILDYHDAINYYSNPSQCTNVIQATGDVAAKNCDDLVFNGASDWYLPSIGDLELVYTNLISQGLGDFENTTLSSSTQSPTEFNKSMVLLTPGGGTFGIFKYDLTNHRAIRDF